MEENTSILNELKTLSPLIAGMSKVNVFTVPQDYFEHVSDTVLACLPAGNKLFNVAFNKRPQDVPEGYFDQLAGSVLNKVRGIEKAADETINLSPLLFDLRNSNVFKVPAGYFESLASVIINKINTSGSEEEIKEISPLLFSMDRKNVFEVPDKYFNNLANVITSKIDSIASKEEIQEISPLLFNLYGKNVFEVPDRYFNGLPSSILKIVKPSPAKIVSLPQRRSFIKYAVAAMLIGFTALGISRYLGNTQPTVVNGNNMTFAALDKSIEKGKNMDDSQFNETLKNLNETDIASYLENNGDIGDVAILRNNLGDNNLPTEDDYLLDDKTLDKFLQEIEKTPLNN